MKLDFKKSFAKDLRKIKSKSLLEKVKKTIQVVEAAQSLQEVRHVKKIQGKDNYYRITIGDYRVGILLDSDTVVFIRFLHRKEIYRFFP